LNRNVIEIIPQQILDYKGNYLDVGSVEFEFVVGVNNLIQSEIEILHASEAVYLVIG
jgi:hypothetical protein